MLQLNIKHTSYIILLNNLTLHHNIIFSIIEMYYSYIWIFGNGYWVQYLFLPSGIGIPNKLKCFCQ